MNFSNITSIFGIIGIALGSLMSVWASIKYLLLGNMRLNSDMSKRLYDRIEKGSSWKWMVSNELAIEPHYPCVYQVVTILDGVPFYFSRQERLFTAGWQSKDEVSEIVFLRWNRKKVINLLHTKQNSSDINVSAMTPGGQDRLGSLSYNPDAEVYLNPGSYEDIEADVQRLVNGEIDKTSCLLYGPPGSGKTQFVRYLSKKYNLPINIVFFDAQYNNLDIARMFAEVPRNCIVLMEDFDNYFNGRECVMKHEEVKFTFDSLINSLDGVHNDYRGVLFVMTTNNIDAIDDSLKKRPSRMKFVREFGMPKREVFEKLGVQVSKSQVGLVTLDQAFLLREQQKNEIWSDAN